MTDNVPESTTMPVNQRPITGVILAGGMGRRMGGIDKGLVALDGKPMIAQVIARLAPQVDEILINANRNTEQYAAFGYRVIADAIEGFAGPLAGLERGLAEASHDVVLTVPCDSPFLPAVLVERMGDALRAAHADLAVARTGNQPHPVFCLCKRGLHAHLRSYLAAGGRKIDAWYATLRAVEVAFDDQPEAFSNINTPEELSAHANRVGGHLAP